MSKTNDQRAARSLMQATPGLSYQRALERVRSKSTPGISTIRPWRYESVLPAGFVKNGNPHIPRGHRQLIEVRADPHTYRRGPDGTWVPSPWEPTGKEWTRAAISERVQQMDPMWDFYRKPADLFEYGVQAMLEVKAAGPRMPWRLNDTHVDPEDAQWDDVEEVERPQYRTGLLDEYARPAWTLLGYDEDGEYWGFDDASGDEPDPETVRDRRQAMYVAAAGVYLVERVLPRRFNGLIDYLLLDNRPLWRCMFALLEAYEVLGETERAYHLARTMLFLDPGVTSVIRSMYLAQRRTAL